MKRRHQFARRLTAGGAVFATGVAMFLVAGPASPATAAPGDANGGENIALAANGGSISATGQEASGKWGPDLVNDGVKNPSAPSNQQSRWSSNTADDASITVALAEPSVIDHIAIEWEAACAAEYKLQVSTDGASFVDATDVIAPVCGTRDVQKLTTVDDATAYSHVRMQGIERTPIGGVKYGMSMWEFEVWDGAESVVIPSRTDALVPLPQNVEVASEAPSFVLSSEARIVADSELTESAAYLADLLRGSTGFALPLQSDGARDGDIVLTHGDVTGFEGQEEAYALTSTDTGVHITSATDHGAFNAVQTLRQLLPAFVEADTEVITDWTVPAVEISDAPRFGYRATMLDVARSFLTVDEVKSFLDTMAAFKLSTLHFHLADDQGWRLEITNEGKTEGDPIDYSQLTARSGATAMIDRGFNNELGRTGYYTQDEYKELVAYAADLHIDVIPEIDTPGHTNAALHAIEELNTPQTRPGVDESGRVPANGTGNVGYSTLDANDETTWVFLEHVLSQLAAITPGDYLHVGGDESHVTPHDDYVKFITRSVGLVHSLGKKTMGWNEAAIGGLEQDDVLQYWVGGTENTLKAVKDLGAKLVVSQSNRAYLDMKYNSKTPIGLTWAGTGDFPQYYDWDPAGVVTDGGQNLPDEYILGVEGPMWAETLRGGEQVEFLAFPRAISHAEVGWTPQDQRDVADFTDRMASVGERLLAMETNFYDGAATSWNWSTAGLPAAVSPSRDVTLSVATVAAPGTRASEDGSSIAVDRVDDADGVSASALAGSTTAVIDWGDGSPTTPATFRTEATRTSLSAGGLYTLQGSHSYASAGEYEGTVTFSDGTVTAFTTTVAEGTPDPVVPEGWDDSVTPQIDVADKVNAGDRLPGTLSGFEPGSYVTITIGDREVGTVRPDEDGRFDLSLPVVPATYGGTYDVTATMDGRTASDQTVVTSTMVRLLNRLDQAPMSVVDVDSEETSGEQAGAANALDGDPNTFWHTQWQGGSPNYPHWITIDLGAEYDVTGFAYTQRAGQSNGRMKDFEVYVSDSPDEFDEPALTGSFLDLTREQVFEFEQSSRGRYLKLVGLSSISGNTFGGAAEIVVGGTVPGEDPIPSVAVQAGVVTAGEKATVTATGFAADTAMTAELVPTAADSGQRVLALQRAVDAIVLSTDLRTDADGNLEAELLIPSDVAAGDYSLTLTQDADGTSVSASAALQVLAAPGDGDGDGDGTGNGDGNGDGDGNGNGDGTGAGGNGADDSSSGGSATDVGDDDGALAITGGTVATGAVVAAVLALLTGGLLVLRRRRTTLDEEEGVTIFDES